MPVRPQDRMAAFLPRVSSTWHLSSSLAQAPCCDESSAVHQNP